MSIGKDYLLTVYLAVRAAIVHLKLDNNTPHSYM